MTHLTQSPLARLVAEQVRAYCAANDDALQLGLYNHVLQEVEKPLLLLALQRCAGNQLKAAALLGINRNTLRKKMREHGLLPLAARVSPTERRA
jgi:Fis family transcriptional regulator, factor for inversion stimulation protein